MNTNRKNRRFVAAVVGAGALVMATGVAYTAANTVETSNAGDGSATISGYTITNQDYVLDTTDPDLINSVSFNLANDGTGADTPGDVYIQPDADGAWYVCVEDLITAGLWDCDTTVGTQLTAANADSFRVVAAD